MMGVHPRDVDRLTPAEFALLWRFWKRRNLPQGEAAGGEITDAEVAAYRDAERKYGSAS